ncbi:spermine oxidase-like [Leptopilina boulardi]|uniref:spermine oxidase-like n=1 Tax=Leptopilina boulardi TaxID=63433 RepID=UPI0021F59F2E|nr:spermine oxidase-like [Leptopilina boulardi]
MTIFKKKLFNISLILTIILKVNTEEISPSVIIVGAGVSGIAAASKLFQNGFKNIKILEAENKIGGRIYTTQFKNYVVDLGAQWVHGEEGNIALEIVQPLGLVEKSNLTSRQHRFFNSSGNKIADQAIIDDFNDFYYQIDEKLAEYAKDQANVSKGEYFTKEFNNYFKAHSDLKENEKGLLHLMNMVTIIGDAGDSWWDISTTSASEYHDNVGDHLINWKERGYGTMLDILMKRFPNPEEELPVLNNTILNAEVTSINYSDPIGKVKVKTANGDLYLADHVIYTCSLGVLKDEHKSLFQPHLSEEKQKTIKALGFGVVGKIYLYFDEPWWSEDSSKISWANFIWNDKDFEMLENDPKKKWLLGLVGFDLVEHKPKLLEGWLAGNYTREMEKLSDEEILNHCIEVLQRFLGKTYNITTPSGMIRTKWNSNNHFKGSYSFRSMKSDAENIWASSLSEPIDEINPKILFAGEATNPHLFGTVQGAIETGWREAERILAMHSNIAKN